MASARLWSRSRACRCAGGYSMAAHAVPSASDPPAPVSIVGSYKPHCSGALQCLPLPCGSPVPCRTSHWTLLCVKSPFLAPLESCTSIATYPIRRGFRQTAQSLQRPWGRNDALCLQGSSEAPEVSGRKEKAAGLGIHSHLAHKAPFICCVRAQLGVDTIWAGVLRAGQRWPKRTAT